MSCYQMFAARFASQGRSWKESGIAQCQERPAASSASECFRRGGVSDGVFGSVFTYSDRVHIPFRISERTPSTSRTAKDPSKSLDECMIEWRCV